MSTFIKFIPSVNINDFYFFAIKRVQNGNIRQSRFIIAFSMCQSVFNIAGFYGARNLFRGSRHKPSEALPLLGKVLTFLCQPVYGFLGFRLFNYSPIGILQRFFRHREDLSQANDCL